MKKHVIIICALALLAFTSTPHPVFAADCAKKARKIAKKNKAELLGVADLGGGNCEATIRIPGKNGNAPRVVKKSF